MKTRSILLPLLVLLSLAAFGQQLPTNLPRGGDMATQVDNFLVALKRFGIPTADRDTLVANVSSQNSLKIIYNTTLGKLRGFDPVTGTWKDIGGGSVPNLQQVTDVGNVTTNPITARGVLIGDSDGNTLTTLYGINGATTRLYNNVAGQYTSGLILNTTNDKVQLFNRNGEGGAIGSELNLEKTGYANFKRFGHPDYIPLIASGFSFSGTTSTVDMPVTGGWLYNTPSDSRMVRRDGNTSSAELVLSPFGTTSSFAMRPNPLQPAQVGSRLRLNEGFIEMVEYGNNNLIRVRGANATQGNELVTLQQLADSLSGVSATWGGITGVLSAQADLQTALDAKINRSGGSFTGAVAWSGVPTQNAHLANKQYVDGLINSTTLQAVTTRGNTTNTRISLTGADGLLTDNGMDIVGGSPSTGSNISKRVAGEPVALISLQSTGDINLQSGKASEPSHAALRLTEETPSFAGVQMKSSSGSYGYFRASAAPAIGDNDLVTLAQLRDSIPSVANGLHRQGNTIKLGANPANFIGSLTESVYLVNTDLDAGIIISVPEKQFRILGGNNARMTLNDVTSVSGETQSSMKIGSRSIIVSESLSDPTAGNILLDNSTNSVNLTDSATYFSQVAEYIRDESLRYTDRSFTDKEYVDNSTALGFGMFRNSTTNAIQLGENMTPDARVIPLSGNDFLAIGDVAGFSYTGFGSNNASMFYGNSLISVRDVGASGSAAVTIQGGTGSGAKVEYKDNGWGMHYTSLPSDLQGLSLAPVTYVDRAAGKMLTHTASGNGTATVFTVPHGLTYTPTMVLTTPNAVGAISPTYATVDATNVTITFFSAPPSGTNNLKWTILVK